MGRTSDARERLLDAAQALMHQRGYAAIGVAEICARADVRKGSFYHFFASKEALSIAAIDAYWAAQRPAWLAARDGDADPVARLEAVVRAQVDAQHAYKAATGNLDGCLLANLGIELSDREPLVRNRIQEIFDEQIGIVTDIVTQIGVPDPVDAARSVLAQLEGAVLFAKLRNDPMLLDGLWDQTRRLIGVQANA